MGQMFLINGGGGGGVSNKFTLNPNYPQDLTIMESATASANLSIVFDTGDTTLCTYQWYMDNNAIANATSNIYSYPCTIEGTHQFYCIISNGSISVKSKTATIEVLSCLPVFTFNAKYQIFRETNNRYNWWIKIFNTGKLNFSSLGNASISGIDFYIVGGGGSGGTRSSGGSNTGQGGAGGYNTTIKNYYQIQIGTDYTATIGAGGASVSGETAGKTGGTSSIFGYSANGGAGGVAGGNAAAGTSRSASPFGSTIYGTYGAGGASGSTGASGGTNTAAGGSGGKGGSSGAGGSGVIIIRNSR